MKWEKAIIWFRNYLRLHVNEALVRATEHVKEVYPVYVLDERMFGKTSFGFSKTGSHRAIFLLESLAVLRERLRSKGSDLIIRKGKPEEIIPRLAAEIGAKGVFAHQEVTSEETKVEDALEREHFRRGVTLEMYWGATM